MKRHSAVFVGAAGSGGHIYPALAFVDRLLQSDNALDVYVVTGQKKIEAELLGGFDPDRVLRLRLTAFRGGRSLVSPAFWAGLFTGFWDAWTFLRRFHPGLVIGFGGFPTIPLVILARLMGVKTLIHEQNRRLGLANRLLSAFATRVAVTFEVPPSRLSSKTIRVGMPLRRTLRKIDRLRALIEMGLDAGKRTLLIMGGSQGSRFLNRTAQGFIEGYGDRIRESWQLIHLSGGADFGALKAFYSQNSISCKLFSFFEDMSIIYACADLVVCRAGAVTLHEVAFFERCAILVPYPEARQHQVENAEVLAGQEAAFVIPQEGLNAGRLDGILGSFEADPERASRMARKAGMILDTRGAEALVRESLRLMGG